MLRVGKNSAFAKRVAPSKAVDSSSKANRGMDFEHFLSTSNDMYAKKGIACIVKVPTAFIPTRVDGKIVSAMVRQKSICDYLGTIFNKESRFGVPFAMEAKSVKNQKDAVRFDAVKPHQADFLSRWEKNGGVSVVVVSFGLEKFVCVPWSEWNALQKNSVGKRSWHFDEFPEEMRFSIGGRVPVDYLKVVENICLGG